MIIENEFWVYLPEYDHYVHYVDGLDEESLNTVTYLDGRLVQWVTPPMTMEVK